MTEAEHLRELAQACQAAHPDDLDSAAEAMKRAVVNHAGLFRAMMEPLLLEACRDRLRSMYQKRRAGCWAGVLQKGEHAKPNGQRLVALAKTLLDFPLPHNLKPLREATAADLVEGAAWYETRVKDMAHKARWLRNIAAAVPRGKVGNKLTADQLRKMQEESA